jgi:hypothetical protein
MRGIQNMYPQWAWFPRQDPPPSWVSEFIQVFTDEHSQIDSKDHKGLTSDQLVALVRERLVSQGWIIEEGKLASQKIHRPVLYGDNGEVRVRQLWDASDIYRTVYFRDPVNRERIHSEHQEIIDALKSRDAQALIRAQNNHREHAVQALTTVISR